MSSKRFLVAIEKVQYLSLTVIRICPIRFYMERLLISSKSLFIALKFTKCLPLFIPGIISLVRVYLYILLIHRKGFFIASSIVMEITFKCPLHFINKLWDKLWIVYS